MRTEAVVFLAAATGALAQSSSSSFSTLSSTNTSMSAPVIVTMTIDNCASSLAPTIITVTEATTAFYCPSCTASSATASVTPMTTPTAVPHTTIYTTYFQSLCTTGSSWYTTPVVYTVTESCADATPSWASASNYVPPGYTTTVVECHKCTAAPSAVPSGEPAGAPSPTAVPMITLTQPCDCTHTGFYAGATPSPAAPTSPASGSPAPAPDSPAPGSPAPGSPAPAPGSPEPSGPAASAPPAGEPALSGAVVSQISDGQVQAPTAGPSPTGGVVTQISDGQVQAPAGTPAPGNAVTQISDGQVQAPAPTGSNGAATTVRCPGPQCAASSPAASTGVETYVPGSSASTIFASKWVGAVAGVAAFFVGGLAVLL